MTVDANLPQFLKGNDLFRRGLRHLLNVNQPVPRRSAEEVASEVKRNYQESASKGESDAETVTHEIEAEAYSP